MRRNPNGPVHSGFLSYNNLTIPCSLGRSGITARKREGDGATPFGEFSLLYGYFRADREKLLPTNLRLIQLSETSGWCDESTDPNYNAYVELPYPKSTETMMRDDRLYDFCLVLDYNISPKARFMGSAIFFHLTRPDMGPTEGCIAIAPEHMRKLLPKLTPETVMRVHI